MIQPAQENYLKLMSAAPSDIAQCVFHAIVPAAGVGQRLGLPTPKQYLKIGDRTILQWTVDVLCEAAWIQTIVVVVSRDDQHAELLFADKPRVQVQKVGGATRRDSVRNGLACLPVNSQQDWVLVQDAARPGLTLALLNQLKAQIEHHPVGGLLAIPVADTVKRQALAADRTPQVHSQTTVARDGLWLAQTPQVFRRELLERALDNYPGATDESQAVEALGLTPCLVQGTRENFKVTTIEDYRLMQRLLETTKP